MASSIGMFGTYAVDEDGESSGDRVEGSTSPNWIGHVRAREDLRVVVDGDLTVGRFTRPDSTGIVIVSGRVR